MVKKSDIFNIQRQYGLRKAEKDNDDTRSVAMWVDKNEGDAFFCYCPLAEDNKNFILGIQMASQKEKLLQSLSNVICINATHGTTGYKGYLLVTVIVITDQGKGFPAAWFIVSSKSEEVLTTCFKALYERVGPLATKFFMSDDAPAYWNAWITAFGESSPHPRKLLCSWHVKRNWKLNIRSKVPVENQNVILVHLDELMVAESEDKFNVLIVSFKRKLSYQNCGEFQEYFFRHYCGQPWRQLEWALYARRDSIVNTNTHLEAFHERLKYNFFDGKQNRRMYVLLAQLLDVAVQYVQDYKLATEYGLSAGTFRLRLIHQWHQRSASMQKESVKAIDDGWLVPSESQPGRYYTLKLQKRSINQCSYQLKCRLCSVCPDIYYCNYLDAVMPTTACKHMHLIHSLVIPKLNRELVPEGDIDKSPEIRLDDTMGIEVENGHGMEDLEADVLKLLEWSRTAEIPNSNTLAAMKRKAKELLLLTKFNFSSIAPEISEEAGPSNKQFKRQRRY